jgi:hypothetical protein
MTTALQLTATDIDALDRALVAVCRRSPEDAARYEAMLRDKTWHEVALSAAYSMQVRSLRLRPWECPPMDCSDIAFKNGGYGHTAKEVRPRLRMKALGLSVYEPSPAEAIKEADRKRRSARRSSRPTARSSATEPHPGALKKKPRRHGDGARLSSSTSSSKERKPERAADRARRQEPVVRGEDVDRHHAKSNTCTRAASADRSSA